MSWDKRKTERRASSSSRNPVAAHIVYVGVSAGAAAAGVEEDHAVRVGDRFRIKRGDVLTIGRGDRCEVTLRSRQLSGAHALLTFLPGRSGKLALIDLQTRNGCWVDDDEAKLHELEPGGEFSLARAYRFRYQPVFDDEELSAEG